MTSRIAQYVNLTCNMIPIQRCGRRLIAIYVKALQDYVQLTQTIILSQVMVCD